MSLHLLIGVQEKASSTTGLNARVDAGARGSNGRTSEPGTNQPIPEVQHPLIGHEKRRRKRLTHKRILVEYAPVVKKDHFDRKVVRVVGDHHWWRGEVLSLYVLIWHALGCYAGLSSGNLYV